MVTLNWNVLPAEMKYSVVELLNAKDTAAFAKASREAYHMSVPTMFADIKLNTFDALRSFVLNVPAAHCRYVRTLQVELSTPGLSATQISGHLHELLSRCVRVEELSLKLAGSLKPTVIPCFERLHYLTKLSITNVAQEETSPLSERLAVSIAASIPNLADLTLDRITRSAIHAPELLGAYPFIPIVLGDDDVPAHRYLGSRLSLPSLLQIPSLRALRVRDTHLGDPEWSRATPRCRLDTLELGSSCYESADHNRTYAECILAHTGRSLQHLTLGSPVIDVPTLKHLRTLRVASVFPLEHLYDTLCALAAAPVADLAIECHEDDAEDMCDVLEDFLSQCVERHGEGFFTRLLDVSLCTLSDELAHAVPACASKIHHTPSAGGAAAAIQRMQDFVRDVRSNQKNATMQASR
ncbi:hypothetical protein EIP86_011613 [Pleurotus ostreatoroseus]|nr:hypothetical protein EIP86_011613 [Pleurotus ostreatoroseus]